MISGKRSEYYAYLVFLFLVPLKLCAGGAFLYEFGSPEVGLASSGWSSRCEDASCVFTNPAGMTRLKKPQVMLGIQPLYQHIKFHPNSKTSVHGKKGNASAWVPAGSFFAATPVSDRISVGFGVIGYIGASLDYGRHWVGRYYVTKTELQSFSFMPSIAAQVTDKLSLGAGLNIVCAMTRARANVNNVLDKKSDGQVKISDNTCATGFSLGALYQFSERSRLGIQYLSEVKLQFRDRPNFTGLGKGLRTILKDTGVLHSKLKLNVHMPQSVMVSLYQGITNKLALMVDFGWQQWTRFQQTQISLADPESATITFTPKYRNTRHFAVGAEYLFKPSIKGTCGFAYDTSCVHTKQRTVGFPVGAQWRYGAGIQYSKDRFEVNLSYELMTSRTLKIYQNRGPLTGVIAGKFKGVNVHFYSISLIWSF